MKKLLLMLTLLFCFTGSKAALPMGGPSVKSCFLYDAATGKLVLKVAHGYPNTFWYYWDNPFTTWAYVRSGATTYGPFIVTGIVPGTNPLNYFEVSIRGFSTQECYDVWYTSNAAIYPSDPGNTWGYTPPPNLDQTINHYIAPTGASFNVDVTEVYRACVCEESDSTIDCNSNIILNMKYSTVSLDPVVSISTIVNVELVEFHPFSTYTYEFDGFVDPFSPKSRKYSATSSATSHVVCITERTNSGDSCKTCVEFCVPAFNSAFMRKTNLQMEGNSMLLYPNPANNKTELQLSLIQKEAVLVSVFDMAGKKVMDLPAKIYEAGAQKIELNTQSLPAGIYQVHIAIGDKISTKKLSVNK